MHSSSSTLSCAAFPLCLVALILLPSVPRISAEGCPKTVDEGGIWPSSTPMEAREVPQDDSIDSVLSGPATACCLFKWALPTSFGAVEDLAEIAATDELYCTSAVTMDEFAESLRTGRAVTASGCVEECDAWGPPLGTECCRVTGSLFTFDSNSSAEVPVPEDVASYHTVPWIPIDLCPAASNTPNKLLGYNLEAEPTLGCPSGGVGQGLGSSQSLEFSTELKEHFKEGTYVLAFHRKLELSPMTVTFEVKDATGSVVIPEQTLVFDGIDGSSGRRRLLKRSGGGFSSGGSRGSSYGSSKGSPSSSFSSSPSTSKSSKSYSSGLTGSYTTKSGKTYSTVTSSASFSNGARRYTNSKGYPVATSSDLSSKSVSRGTLLASAGGGGAVYWGTSRYSSTYYGAPASFGNSWYSGGYNSYGYGYGGRSYWGPYIPIFIWTRPYGCYSMYGCHYHHHRPYHGNREEDKAAKEFRTVHLPCDMAMDLVMESSFEPSLFTLPLTLTIKSVEATVDESKRSCLESFVDKQVPSIASGSLTTSTGLKLNETSTPYSPALYATFVRMEDVEVMESSGFSFASSSSRCSIFLAAVMIVLMAFGGGL